MDSAPPDPVASDQSGESAPVHSAPGSGPNVDVIHAECPTPASVVDVLMRSPELGQEAPTSSNLQVCHLSAPDSNDATDSSSFALPELDLSKDALFAPTPEPAASMKAGDGQLAQSMEDLSLLSSCTRTV
ncbi:unnamed protein product [Haemonchus placei]|uniref:Uncharacterized protein n=1 Tax=Haemonchus placei TaxID=6290 RepID=A0A0N4WG74_HAEPC|nr:unnamed protein product [Haemonchus placei]